MMLWTEYLTQTWLLNITFCQTSCFTQTPKYTVKIQPITLLWTIISSNSIVENSFGNGGHRVVSAVETCRIVGR
jgi:hypothetical protein